jgi:hypothetical protein
VLLYRLLFCLHAEDRGLLPVDNPHYREYSLRDQRERVRRAEERGRVFSPRSDDLYNDLRALFRIVDRGDPALGVNEYDGGLFAAAAHPWLRGRSVPDALMAQALQYLYRVGGESVDYRDLSVRHLGTIYERLLAYRLRDVDGVLVLASTEGRRETGSYFTPEFIVDEIVDRTLGPRARAPLAGRGGCCTRWPAAPTSSATRSGRCASAAVPLPSVEGAMRLLAPDELDALPLTAAYLRSTRRHCAGASAQDGPRRLVRLCLPKSLGAHDLPKLGVPRMCARLRASADADGAVYLDNVDVNGILLKATGSSCGSCSRC